MARFIGGITLLDMTTIIKMLWKSNAVMINTGYSLFAWSAQGVILYLVLIEFDVDINIGMAISIYCLSLLFGVVSFIPSGIGVTEIGMVWLLTQIGVDREIAVMSSLLTRTITLWPAMLVGLICSYHLKNGIPNNQ